MVRGKKPKPAATRQAEGNRARRPIRVGPDTAAGLPDAPAHLIDEALAEWHRMVPVLDGMGLLGKENRATLAIYCANWARMVEAEAHVSEHGSVVPAPRTGVPMHNPYLSIANKAAELVSKMAAEFGMTPSSRTRVSGQARTEEDPADEFLGGGLRLVVGN